MPHASQRSLNEDLVFGMTAGHKPKRSLHFHVTKADVAAAIVCLRSKHSL